MKISDGFDARRLRPKGRGNWRTRIGALVAAILAVLGILLVVAGVSSLTGRAQAMGDLGASPTGAALVAAAGLLVFYLGVLLWRRCRRRQRGASGLSMSAHLMKKHD